MAILETNKQSALKFMTLVAGLDGVQRTRTTTFSNLVDGVSNEALLTGAKAIIGLLKTAPAQIMRVDEVTLEEQV